MGIQTVVISEFVGDLALFDAVLELSEYEIVYRGASIQDLLSMPTMSPPELIIVNINESDKKIVQQLKLINEQFPLPIVVFTKHDNDDAIDQFIDAGVSSYIVDGLSGHRVLSILKTAMVRFEQNLSIREELKSLRTNLADRKTIDKAKGIIMAQRQCSEDDAYTLLRTNAMSQNLRMAVLAKQIIETADLLTPS